jgi:predicted DNA-binding protein (UPF0278 family)
VKMKMTVEFEVPANMTGREMIETLPERIQKGLRQGFGVLQDAPLFIGISHSITDRCGNRIGRFEIEP